MKKLVFLLLISSFSSSVFAVDCNNIYATWRGNLGNISNVNLFIHKFDGMESANIKFTLPDTSRIEYGLFVGSCKKNKDGSITMDLTRDSYSVHGVINVKLIDEHTLSVNSFTFRDPYNSGSGSGVLNR